jgi:hypothetical protein
MELAVSSGKPQPLSKKAAILLVCWTGIDDLEILIEFWEYMK